MDNRTVWDRMRPYVMIAPSLAGIFTFVVYPIGYLIYLSFYKYNLMNRAKSKYVGWDNYREIFTRDDFYKALGNTLIYTGGVVALTMVLALLTALWLKRGSRLNAIVQGGIFIPHIVSIVSVSLVWLWMMEPNHGLLNAALRALGLPPSQWLQSSRTALVSVIVVAVWQAIGYYTLILAAALRNVPPSIYEAAELDNAGRVKMFFRITLPLISPQLFFILVIMTIGSFKVFDIVQIMTGGGPNDATTTLVYYIFSYRTGNIGYAAASGVSLMAMIGLLTFVYFRLLSRRVHYQ